MSCVRCISNVEVKHVIFGLGFQLMEQALSLSKLGWFGLVLLTSRCTTDPVYTVLQCKCLLKDGSNWKAHYVAKRGELSESIRFDESVWGGGIPRIDC